MRLDKFLQLTRALKRRSQAWEVCEAGQVQINGRVARPHSEVKAEDRIEVDLRDLRGERILVRALQIPERGSLKPEYFELERIREHD